MWSFMSKDHSYKHESCMWEPNQLYLDTKSTISITHNLLWHDQTKYIEINWHFIKKG